MSDDEDDSDELWEDLDDMIDEGRVSEKPGAIKKDPTPAEIAATEAAALQAASQAAARRAAQVANLMLSGMSISEIAASTGSTTSEIEKMLNNDMASYIRTQPALRQWARRFLSGKFTDLLEAVWDQATDKTHREQLLYHDRARNTLKDLARLHGAEAPTQTEVTVDAAPTAVQAVVDKIAASQGLAYDVNIFDLDDDDVTELVEEAPKALEAAEAVVDGPLEEDGDL